MQLSESTRRFLTNWAVMFTLITGTFMFAGVMPFTGLEPKLIFALFMAWWYTNDNPRQVLFRVDKHIHKLLESLNELSDVPHTSRTQSAEKTDLQEQPAAIAERALRRAGLDPQQLPVQLLDIGLLVYRGGERPEAIARDESIRSDASHVRPFLRVNFPLKQMGGDNIRFQLLDAQGKVHYSDDDWYDLKPGDNFLVTKTWLPLNGSSPDGRWTLRVVVGETPFAVHLFRWHRRRLSDMRARLQSDGEIDDRVPTAEKPFSKPLSLDELLSDQKPVARTTARRQ